MKIAPVMAAMVEYGDRFTQLLVHTEQHYDHNMSQIFFGDLGLPQPDVYLGVGSASHAVQTARVMTAFELVLEEYRPDWVVVPGDVNSTAACALMAAKLVVKVAHVEAGLRSFDRTMPEEINRVVTDHLADLLFTTEQSGNDDLFREGVSADKVHFVGNTMIDTLVRLLPRARERWPELRAQLGVKQYLLVTLHRPSNVDHLQTLGEILAALSDLAAELPVLFPVHPRTRQRIQQTTHLAALQNPGLRLIDPLGYLDFLALQPHAALVLTDCGGVQEETTYLGVPCLTVRPNTERPVTVTDGTNRLVPGERMAIVAAARDSRAIIERHVPAPPTFWDGRAGERIAAVMSLQP